MLRLAGSLAAYCALVSCSGFADRAWGEPLRVLLFTKTVGFVHPSIDDGVGLMNALALDEGFRLDVSADASDFTSERLSHYDVTVWLSTTGDVLDPGQQSAFESFVQAGGGWVGIHAAADCEYGWPWYGELLGNGAWFASHPVIQEALLITQDFSHPATVDLPVASPFTDEWYNFQANPRAAVRVLQTLDETTYSPGAGAMGSDHPITWYHDFGGGRSFYTALGHRPETYADPRFRQLIRGAVLWAGGHLLFEDGFEGGDLRAWSGGVL